ncbi:FKBP-type peptidyl-prolyl cis-trans isomerase [Sulfuriflexus sp.]|uniref:FKBP-type peptidyl-prolyl cis-trans isomerase n=1 Tax=Sulfuriflexus sp. TaxID=2015443 RepID=UPI0028CBF1F2|nr:FKBP-type peptidyl-prolyl cis-trans isomerase [Sulfuriflexus sp.]MDT8403978.1 FKBP-type peptidyl-prolyl cis-trans isomerase [Sulfuriflexus sp.]
MKRTLIVLACTMGLAAAQVQAEELKLDDDGKKLSYTLGFQIAQNLARQGMSLDAEATSRAVHDVFSGAKPLLTAEEMQAVVTRVQEVALEQRKKMAEANQKAGDAFLAENKGKEGVKTLDSGLQYKVVKAGTGKSPGAKDEVEVHYEGRFTNGKVFDSSIERGESVSFAVDKVVSGWTEALQLMKEGARWEIYIPSNLAYGEKGAGNAIGPNETLVFDVQLLKVK